VCDYKLRYVSVTISHERALGSRGSCVRRSHACEALCAMPAASPQDLLRVPVCTPTEMFIANRLAADYVWWAAKQAADVSWRAEQTAMHTRVVAQEARENSSWMEVLAASARAIAAAAAHHEHVGRLIRPCDHNHPIRRGSCSRSRD
jgi:hypothetical protein